MSRPEALEHLRAGRPQVAAALLELSLRDHPTDAQSWFLLGACRHAIKDLSRAAAAFSRSIDYNPGNPEAHLALVTVLREQSDWRSALDMTARALARFPGNPRLLYAAALSLEDRGQHEEALASYECALAVTPDLEDALNNKGLLLARLGRHEEAEAIQRRYVAAHPRAPRAYAGLVDALLALHRFDDALKALNDFERLVPGDISIRIRRGVALAALRKFKEAKRAFTEATARDPEAVADYVNRVSPGSDPAAMLSPENIYLGWAWKALGQCDWTEWDEFTTELLKSARRPDVTLEPAVAFMSRLLPLAGDQRQAVSRHIAANVESRYAVLPPAPRKTKTRIRIGVLSPDFREHLNAYLLLPLFELLDRERFELFGYSLVADDGSAIRDCVRSAADVFRDLQPLTDHDSAMSIRGDDIDILIDVGGFTTGARFAIAAQRPARIQVNYLGFSSSVGSRRMDYTIVDRIVGSDDAEWAEERVYLPHTHFLYDFRAENPAASLTRRDYGLPEDAFIFCAFHRSEKISPDVFALWMDILSRVPRSILWFRALSDAAAQNLRLRAKRTGVDPARLAFAPFEANHNPRYLARHTLGDLMLDSLHHNAMTSACDALGMGLPLLTLPGHAMAARAGESLVRAAGLPELVARSKDDYVNKAVKLGSEPALLIGLRERLRENRNSAPLFDTAGRVRELEAAFQGMYDRMMRGEPPTSFDVQL